MEEAPPCKVCGRPKEFREAGTRKDGTTYDAFWGCPDWKNTIHKNAKEKWQKKSAPIQQKGEIGWEIIEDEIKALKDKDKELEDRLDRASEFYAKLRVDTNKLMGK